MGGSVAVACLEDILVASNLGRSEIICISGMVEPYSQNSVGVILKIFLGHA